MIGGKTSPEIFIPTKYPCNKKTNYKEESGDEEESDDENNTILHGKSAKTLGRMNFISSIESETSIGKYANTAKKHQFRDYEMVACV